MSIFTRDAVPTFRTPKQYAREKLKMLRTDMEIKPTKEKVAHLYSLKTRGDIDRAVHDIIKRAWE
jgi:hypothetical protein